MHNDGILLLVNELGMHKTTMSERVSLQFAARDQCLERFLMLLFKIRSLRR